MSEQHEAHNIVVDNSPTLGERLQDAREKKKLSEAEVAAQLRINKNIVIYLESQQWDKLPGRTYARGYYANYVKFLGLPYEEMLALFNHEYTAVEPDVDLKQFGHKVKGKGFPWGKLLIWIVLAAIIWFAYQQWQQSQPNLAALPFLSQFTQHGTDAEHELSQPVTAPAVETDNIEDSQPDESEPAVPTEYQDELDTSEAMDLQSAEVDAMSEQSDVTPVESEPTPVITSETHLQLSFNAKCWVEVTDSEAKVLASEMMDANQTLKFDSKAPLNILLGRASTATVMLNGKVIDLKPYIQGDVARLTLGVES